MVAFPTRLNYYFLALEFSKAALSREKKLFNYNFVLRCLYELVKTRYLIKCQGSCSRYYSDSLIEALTRLGGWQAMIPGGNVVRLEGRGRTGFRKSNRISDGNFFARRLFSKLSHALPKLICLFFFHDFFLFEEVELTSVLNERADDYRLKGRFCLGKIKRFNKNEYCA